MWAFLVEQPNLPYTIAFACVLALGVFEVFALFIGLSMLSALDQWVPADVEHDADVGAGGLTGIAGCHEKQRLRWRRRGSGVQQT